MAVLATSNSITLSTVIDIQGFYRYYLLQSSTSAVPSKPTTNPPTGNWTDTEPTYTTGSTNSLYFVDLTVFNNGTFEYTDVSLSSSYEAAKAAYNQALLAQEGVHDINDTLTLSNTVTGSMVHVTDAAAVPAEEVIVDISPVQDLHGYDSPWPGGCGKNLWDPDNSVAGYVNANTGLISAQGSTYLEYASDYLPITGDKVTVGYFNYGEDEQHWLCIGFYDDTKTFISRSAGTAVTAITRTASVPSNAVYFRASVRTFGHGLQYCYACNGNDTAYAPYANICPISGWTGANVYSRGINLWDEDWELGDLNGRTGGLRPSTTIIRSKNFCPIQGGITIRMSNTATYSGGFWQYDRDYNPICVTRTSAGTDQYYTTITNNRLLTLKDNCRFFKLTISGSDYTTPLSVNYPETHSDYYPYVNGQSHNIGWQSSHGTIYGGTLDVTNGKLIVDRAIFTLNSANMTDDTYPGWRNVPGLREAVGTGINKVFGPEDRITCSVGSYCSINTMFSSNSILMLPISRYGLTLAQWQAFAMDIQFILPFASPIAYDLSPIQVQMLLGDNSIWADTGDTTLTYCRDTTLFSGVIKQAHETATSAQSDAIQALEEAMAADARAQEAEEIINNRVDSFAQDIQQLSLELNRTNGVIEGAVMKDDLSAYVRYGLTTGGDGTLELGQNDSRYVARVSPENGFQVIIDGTEMSAMRKNTISSPVVAPRRMIQIGDNVVKLSTDGGLIFN